MIWKALGMGPAGRTEAHSAGPSVIITPRRLDSRIMILIGVCWGWMESKIWCTESSEPHLFSSLNLSCPLCVWSSESYAARMLSLKESWIEMLRDFLDYSYSLHFCTCTVQPFSFAECHWPFGQSMWSASLCTQDVLQWWSVRHRVRQAFHSKLVQAHCEGNKLVQVQAVMFWNHHNFPFLLSFLLPCLMTTRDFCMVLENRHTNGLMVAVHFWLLCY